MKRPRPLGLAAWLGIGSGIIVLLAVLAVAVASAGLLGRLVRQQAMTRVELAAASARDYLRRVNEDVLAAARELAGRPTLVRLLLQGDMRGIEPVLARYAQSKGLYGCLLVNDGGIAAAAGQQLPWAELEPALEEQGERFAIASREAGVILSGAAAPVPRLGPYRVIALRAVDGGLLAGLQEQYPSLVVQDYEVYNNLENRDLFFAIAEKNGIEPVEHVVARDAIAVVVHPSNPVNGLTLQQISDIYTRKITNWQQVGGEDRPIVLLSRESNSGTYVYFLEEVIRMGDKKSKLLFSPDTLLMPSSEGISAEVRQNPNAIGYDGLGYVTPDQKMVGVAKKDGEPFVLPSVATVNDGTYPISRDLFMYTAGQPQGKIKAYLDFILGEGQSIVPTLGFVPLKAE